MMLQTISFSMMYINWNWLLMIIIRCSLFLTYGFNIYVPLILLFNFRNIKMSFTINMNDTKH